jgi:tetratricopeptide (TPR) repeat protein
MVAIAPQEMTGIILGEMRSQRTDPLEKGSPPPYPHAPKLHENAATEGRKMAFCSERSESTFIVRFGRPTVMEAPVKKSFPKRFTSMTRDLGSMVKGVLCALCVGALVCAWVVPAIAKQDLTRMYDEAKRQFKAGKNEQAIEGFSKILGLLPTNQRNAYTVKLARAQAYMNKGDLAKAANDITEVLAAPMVDEETQATATRLTGLLHLKRQKYREALKSFTDAIKTPHENEKLRSACFADRGITFINLEETDKAISDLNKAIQLNPQSGFAYAARGMAYLRSDKIEAAKRDSEQALKLDSGAQTAKMAQEILKELSASASGPLSVSVPLDNRGHVLVQVRFSKKGTPHRFLLDTGATNTLIEESLLKKISQETEVTRIGKSKARIADGSTITVTRYKVKTAFLYHLPLGEIEVHVLEKASGKMQNLLGTGSLRQVAVTIDNAKRTAEIRRTESDTTAGSSLE